MKGATGTQDYTLTVTSFEAGTVDTAYPQQLISNRPVGLFTSQFSLTSGELPGLTVTSDGQLNGTPTKAGLYSVTVSEVIQNSFDQSVVNTYSVPYQLQVFAAPAYSLVATDADKPEGNTGTTPFTFTVTRSDNTTDSSYANYVVTGSGTNEADFGNTLPTGTVTFAPNETSKVITIPVSADTAVEPDEGFTVELKDMSGTTIATANGVIRNDDDDTPPPLAGNVDGDADFDASDSFLIHLVQLSGTDAQIDQSKGSSPLTAAEIRATIAQMNTSGDVDGDQDFDASDSFLIHLVQLSGTDAQINQSKGSSPLSAASIRSNVNSLGGNSLTTLRHVQQPDLSRAVDDIDNPSVETAFLPSVRSEEISLFDEALTDLPSNSVASGETQSGPVSHQVWEDFRTWIDAI